MELKRKRIQVTGQISLNFVAHLSDECPQVPVGRGRRALCQQRNPHDLSTSLK